MNLKETGGGDVDCALSPKYQRRVLIQAVVKTATNLRLSVNNPIVFVTATRECCLLKI
jgi:hypothetical protein